VNEPDRFDFAKNLIIEAGDLALQYFASVNELSIMSKGAQDMVSEADIAVEKLIRNRLMDAYPSDGYLGEETGYEEATGDSGIWVVDPIDGTQPFLSGLRSWCVSIAYVRSNEVVLGMVNNPATGELLAAPDDWLNSMGSRLLRATRPRWAMASPSLAAIHVSSPNRSFPCSTDCCGPVGCSSAAAPAHSGSAMSPAAV
jgi:fructose-1,6-bisphosphatase/inositol monophosphatase family enzyme